MFTDVAARTTVGVLREMPRAWKVSIIHYVLIVVFFCHDGILAPFSARLFPPSPSKRSSSGSFRPVVCRALTVPVDVAEAKTVAIVLAVAVDVVLGVAVAAIVVMAVVLAMAVAVKLSNF